MGLIITRGIVQAQLEVAIGSLSDSNLRVEYTRAREDLSRAMLAVMRNPTTANLWAELSATILLNMYSKEISKRNMPHCAFRSLL